MEKGNLFDMPLPIQQEPTGDLHDTLHNFTTLIKGGNGKVNPGWLQLAMTSACNGTLAYLVYMGWLKRINFIG